MVETKTIDGVLEDIKIKEYSKILADGTEKIMKIGRLQIAGTGFTTFDEEMMKAFVVGDAVSIDYTSVVKGDKTFYNIKGIIPTRLVKRDDSNTPQSPVVESQEKIFPNQVEHATFKKFDDKKFKFDYANTEQKIRNVIEKVDKDYGGFKLNVIEIKTDIEGDEVKLSLFRHDPEI